MASSLPHARATHLTDEITSRDLYGTVRGACSCKKCGRYIIITKEKYTSLHQERSKVAKHPDNDVTITYCSRCGCPPDAHTPVQWETEREAGNDAYSLHRWDTAILHYTRAIDANPVEAVLWTNRAAAYNAKGWYHQALHDAERAVALRGAEWYKPWARKAAACLGLKQYREAEAAYSTSIRLAQEHEEEQSVLEVLQQGLVNAKKRGVKDQTNPSSSTARKWSGTSDGACSGTASNVSPSSLAQEVAELRSRVAKLELQVETFKSLLPATATSEPHCRDKVNHMSSEKGDLLETKGKFKEDSPGVVGDGDAEDNTESSVCTIAVEVGDQLSDESGTDGSGSEDEMEFEDERMMKEWMDQVKAARAALLGCSSPNSFVLVPPPPSTRRMAASAVEKDRRQPKPPPTTTTSTEAIATSSSSSQSSQSSKPSPQSRGDVLDLNRLMDILQSDSARDCGEGGNEEEIRQDHQSTEEGLASAPVDLQSTSQELNKPSLSISSEEKDRLDRIQATMLRQQEAEEAGEVLQSTNLDALTQAKRGTCQNCACRPESEERCKGFCVLYRTIDATNPEVMLFCSLCGCPADAHPIDEAWQAEERERIAKEAAFNTNRRRTSHQFHSDHMISGRQLEEERKALAVLGLPPGSDSKSISKAYKRLALLMHPDKRNKTASDQRIEPQVYDDNDDRFVKVTQAYKLLMSRCR